MLARIVSRVTQLRLGDGDYPSGRWRGKGRGWRPKRGCAPAYGQRRKHNPQRRQTPRHGEL